MVILDLEKHYSKVEKMTSSQVADYIEYQIQDIDININTDIIEEDLNPSNLFKSKDNIPESFLIVLLKKLSF